MCQIPLGFNPTLKRRSCCWSHYTHVSTEQVPLHYSKPRTPTGSVKSQALNLCLQRNISCPRTWTQQAEQLQWNMLSGWECVRRCYFSLACFQRHSVETHRGQPDSLLIQDRRHVSGGLYLRRHIPSLRQWITPFRAQTGFDVPEHTRHTVCFQAAKWVDVRLLICISTCFLLRDQACKLQMRAAGPASVFGKGRAWVYEAQITINNLRACKVSF